MNDRRSEASAEQEAFRRKVTMISFLPLEEAMTYVNGPLYGLAEEVCGLQHTGHMWQFENCMRLEYRSPRYEQYKYRHDQTFLITTCISGEDENQPGLFASPHLEAGGLLFVGRFPGQDQIFHFVAKDASFTIDGKCFKGEVTHYTAPVRYSSFMLYHRQIELKGEALGPSLEELIQIVESLHVLNRKQAE